MLYPKFLMNRLITFYNPISQFGVSKNLLWKNTESMYTYSATSTHTTTT